MTMASNAPDEMTDDLPLDDHVLETGSAEIAGDEEVLNRMRRQLRPLMTYVIREVRALEGMAGQRSDDYRPIEVLDAVIAEVLARRDERPADMGTLRWYRQLADEVIARDVRPDLERPEQSLDALVEEGLTPHEEEGFLLPQDIATEQPMVTDVTNPTSLTPEEQVVRDEFQVTFIRAIGELPDDIREAFLLHAREGLTIAEVAEWESISEDEARRQIESARQQLQETLGEAYAALNDLPATETMYQAIEDLPFDDEHLERIIRAMNATGPAGR
jgi:RNA polymerase sigma factor (sigma-70 family)